MSMWKRAMDYLGLGDEDVYEDYDDTVEPRQRGTRSTGGRGGDAVDATGGHTTGAQVRVLPSGGRESDTGARRFPLPSSDDSGVQPRPLSAVRQGSTVRAVVPSAEPQTVKPRRFEDAQEVADRFRAGQSVIMNLEGVERETFRRLVDFASGLCYGLSGSMEKVATGVYLLKPASVRARDERAADGPSEP
jgi:cell division inhibitor SepF